MEGNLMQGVFMLGGKEIITNMLMVAGSVIFVLLSAGLGLLTKALASKVRNQALAKMIQNTDEIVMQAVKSVYQTSVWPHKKQGIALSENQKRQVHALAIEASKMLLGEKEIKSLTQYFGPNINEILHHHIEAAVYDMKTKQNQLPLDQVAKTVSPASAASQQVVKEKLEMANNAAKKAIGNLSGFGS